MSSRDQPFVWSDSTPQVATIFADAPEGHRAVFQIRRSDAEVAELANTCEDLDTARQRLGPRLRCECGRGFSTRIALDEHHRDPARDDRDWLP